MFLNSIWLFCQNIQHKTRKLDKTQKTLYKIIFQSLIMSKNTLIKHKLDCHILGKAIDIFWVDSIQICCKFVAILVVLFFSGNVILFGMNEAVISITTFIDKCQLNRLRSIIYWLLKDKSLKVLQQNRMRNEVFEKKWNFWANFLYKWNRRCFCEYDILHIPNDFVDGWNLVCILFN